MTSINFAGNLATDPELRFTPGGIAVARVTVIENRRRRSAGGEGWEDCEPNVHRVQVWGSQAENVAESCAKGSRVVVVGVIATDRWADKETGESRTAQYVKAHEVAVSLRHHTARIARASRAAAADPGESNGEED